MPLAADQRKRAFPKRPPHPDFSLTTLPADAHLTQYEVAQVKRQTLSWTEKCRLDGTDGLEWVYIGITRKPRCIAGSLQKQMAGSPDKAPQDARLSNSKKLAPPVKSRPTKRRAGLAEASAP